MYNDVFAKSRGDLAGKDTDRRICGKTVLKSEQEDFSRTTTAVENKTR